MLIDIILFWFPFYFVAKLCLLIWCMAPTANNGSVVIYNILRLHLKRQEKVRQAQAQAPTSTSTPTCPNPNPNPDPFPPTFLFTPSLPLHNTNKLCFGFIFNLTWFCYPLYFFFFFFACVFIRLLMLLIMHARLLKNPWVIWYKQVCIPKISDKFC